MKFPVASDYIIINGHSGDCVTAWQETPANFHPH